MKNKITIERGERVTVAREESGHIVLFDGRKNKNASEDMQTITINWSALGSVSVEEAEKFHKNLGAMIRLAKRLGKK